MLEEKAALEKRRAAFISLRCRGYPCPRKCETPGGVSLTDFPPASMRNIPGYVTRIAPDRFSGVGPWASKGAE